MSTTYTVGQYLADRLAQLGLGHLFSIAGDYTIDWVTNYLEPSTIKVVEEVNEMNAGYAADGYARLKGLAALCFTYSPGTLSAVNPIAGAYVEKVPIVLINGTPSVKRTLTFEQTGFSAHHFITGRETDLQCFEHITAAAVRLENPDIAPMLIDYALTQCISSRRPVYIELLQDVVELPCAPPATDLKPARLVSDQTSLAQSIEAIGKALAKAAKPLVWVGIEVDRFGLQTQAEELIRKLGVPYITELLSKSVLPEDDALFAGVFDGKSSSNSVQALVEEADFILALGVWLTDINALGWDPPYDKIAFVSFDTVKYGTYFQAQVALAHFTDGLLASNVTCRARPAAPRPAREPPPADPAGAITYAGFYDFVAPYIGADVIAGTDANLNYFGSILLEVPSRRGFIIQSSYSSIGYIGPAATGLSLAKRDDQRVMVFSGDGGFQMSAQCLSTQTRFKLNPIIFVIDNGIYGVEQWLADSSVFADGAKPIRKACLLHRWHYSKLADVFGCRGWKATTYGELKEAMTGALANMDSPSIIQVVVPSKSIPGNAAWKEAYDAASAR